MPRFQEIVLTDRRLHERILRGLANIALLSSPKNQSSILSWIRLKWATLKQSFDVDCALKYEFTRMSIAQPLEQFCPIRLTGVLRSEIHRRREARFERGDALEAVGHVVQRVRIDVETRAEPEPRARYLFQDGIASTKP